MELFEIVKWVFAGIGATFVAVLVLRPLVWLLWHSDDYRIMVDKMYYSYQQEEMRKAREGTKK